MAGDSANATVWPDADVYWAPDPDEADPATVATPFGAGWDLVGLLDGDAGFVQSRNEETNDLYAWGGIIVRTTRRNFKQTVAFTALEDNDTTRALIWPGSSTTQLVVPRPARGRIAFEMREGSKVKRLISTYQAEVSINGDITDNESDLTRYELLATIFPDTSESPAVLFNVQETEGARRLAWSARPLTCSPTTPPRRNHAMTPAEIEATADTISVTFNGNTYAFPASLDEADGDVIDAVDDMKLSRALRGLLSDEDWKRFKATKPKVKEYGLLFEAYAKTIGLGSSPE